MFLLDSHCDSPSYLLRCRNLSVDNTHGQVDIPKMKRGGVDASFFALYIPGSLDSEQAFAYAGKLLNATRNFVECNADSVAFATNMEQAYRNKEKGLISIFLGLENGSPIGNDFKRLEWFYDQGVRYITLCHNSDNQICDSAAENKSHGGLSSFGKELVHAMNDMGMLIDCAHISDSSFRDVIKYSSKPVVSTHSCCRALSNHRRNMTDDMIRALADNGGVMQVNFYPVFLEASFAQVMNNSEAAKLDYLEDEFIADPSNDRKRLAWEAVEDMYAMLPRPSYEKIYDHIDHVVSLVGDSHVGIGTDFDGICVAPSGMEDISKLPRLIRLLQERGYSNERIEKIASKNFFRVLE